MTNADAFYTAPAGGGAAFDPQPRTWEVLDWASFFIGAGAPSSATGYPNAYWFDTTDEDLYGPATFDPGIPGWDWGSPLANVVISATGPTSEAGDWYVWDENGDGSSLLLFQKKTAVAHDDLIRSQAGVSWEAVSNRMDADRVWYPVHVFTNTAEVHSVKTELNNINGNHMYAYLGGRGYIYSDTVAGAVEINPYDANAFEYTIGGNTTLSIASGLDALDSYNLGTRFAEITVKLTQDGDGGHTVTWDSAIKWHNNDDNVSTGANHVGIWKFISWDDGTTWYGHRWGDNFT